MSIAVKSCSVDGCDSRGKTLKNGSTCFVHGLCMRHYEKYRVYGDPLHGTIHAFGENRATSTLYKTYQGIKKRCFDASDHNYKKYGARGISLYGEWVDTYKGFTKFAEYIEQELGPKPTPRHSLDRIDNDKDYEPGNLRWATSNVQCINRRVPINNTSGHKGVYFSSVEQRWCAVISIEGRKTKLGRFKSKQDAVDARERAEHKYYAPLLDTGQ